MNKWKRLVVAVGLMAALALGVVHGIDSSGNQQAAPAAPAQAAQEKTVPGKGKRAQEFVAAFDRGDAKAVAGFFTPTGEYTDLEGHKHQGRAALEKLYAKLFAENKGAKLTVTVASMRQIAPDAAIEEGMTEVTFPEGGPPSVAAFTAVIVKQDGEWYFESVTERVARPPSNAKHFEDIEWLIGDWAGEATKGESARASYDWSSNRNFIVSTFDTTLNGIPVVGGTQWIGWDAAAKQIRSWTFYSGGGFGEGSWSQTNGAWSVKTTAQSMDGKKITGTNVITPIDKDHVTWQLTNLTVEGQPLPNPPPVKMVRLKGEPEKK